MGSRALILAAAVLISTAFISAPAAPLVIDASAAPSAPQTGYFKMGTPISPNGPAITVDSRSILFDGEPVLPVMGEVHFSRVPAAEWRDELLKMRAGGVNMVATYVFWIHHEEIEGQFDWTGQRSLRDFIKVCAELKMPVIVRLGPWCHGEVRNGGMPDWAVAQGLRLRTEDPAFLAKVEILYGEIAKQLEGRLWKDGGPVFGVQVDNEFRGPASYLLTLKKMAQDAGLDVPVYTRTGWPELRSPMPAGELLPLAGDYAEGFWDRTLDSMPGDYWKAFTFAVAPAPTAIGTDQLGVQASRSADFGMHPYLTCELGGGMITSYHRRILIDPRDVQATAIAKLGSGGNLLGYYMYHGGTNPEGKLTTLNEMQATSMTNYNDMPVRSYEFQAPLGEFGQIHPQYHMLRRIHMFLHDWGGGLAGMTTRLPEKQQAGKGDAETLRWAMRSDSKSGYIFVNNYQRGMPMPAKPGIQFNIKLAAGELTVPEQPVAIPADSSFFLPVNMDIGGAKLAYATAQPIAKLEADGIRYIIFAEIPGVPAEFAIERGTAVVETPYPGVRISGSRTIVAGVPPQRSIAIRVRDGEAATAIVLLSDADSLSFWKGNFAGRDRIFQSDGDVLFDGGGLRVVRDGSSDMALSVFPAPASVTANGAAIPVGPSSTFALRASANAPVTADFQQTKQAGPAREIKLGSQRAAMEPTDSDFDQAARWTIKLPENTDPARDLRLRISYKGDVARVYMDGKLLTDNFYNGNAFEVGLKRYAPDVYSKGLELAVLPLKKDAPIFLDESAKPDFGSAETVLKLDGIEVIETHSVGVSPSNN